MADTAQAPAQDATAAQQAPDAQAPPVAAPDAQPAVAETAATAEVVAPAPAAAEGEAKPEPELPVAKQLAVIARERKAIKREREVFAQERKQHEADLAELEQHRQFDKQLKANAMAALRGKGLSYKQLMQEEMKYLEEQTPEMKRIAALEQERADEKRQAEEARVSSAKVVRDAARANVMSEIVAAVKADEKKFTLIGAYKAEKAVFDKLESNFKETAEYDDKGNLVSFKEMSTAQACELVEQQFREAARMAAEHLKKTEEVTQVVPPAPAAPAPKKKPASKKLFPDDEPEEKPAVLDNKIVQGPVGQRQLTRQERSDLAFRRHIQREA